LKQTVSELDSHHRYINIEWISKECKAWFQLLKMVDVAWNFSSGLQFILGFLHFVVCNSLFATNNPTHSDIGKMKECFWWYVSLKISIFFWELM